MHINRTEKGFSLIELLIVVVIIGIIAAIGVPAYQKATKAAENSVAETMLRTLHSHEMAFYTQNGRFGRLEEIYPRLNGVGVLVGTKIVRGKHTYEMVPATDEELKSDYTIQAVKTYNDALLQRYTLTADGYIEHLGF